MCFPFSPRRRETHKQFDPHPFPGQSREVVYVYWFFAPRCMSAEQCQASRRIFTLADFKFCQICLVNISVGMVGALHIFWRVRCLVHFPPPIRFAPPHIMPLVAPYCAIPRDYLSDTHLLRAMGFLVSQHGQLGAIPPPPFLSFSPLESMRSGGAIPPPSKGVSQRYLRDTL